MAQLHQRGVDLLLNVQMALDHLDEMTPHELREVLQETEIVLRDLLARDVPREPAPSGESAASIVGDENP